MHAQIDTKVKIIPGFLVVYVVLIIWHIFLSETDDRQEYTIPTFPEMTKAIGGRLGGDWGAGAAT